MKKSEFFVPQDPSDATAEVDERDITEIREAAKEMPEFSPLYVPLIEAPKWFGISRDTVYRARKKGSINIYKAGSRSLLKVTEVNKWIEGSSNPA
ncbi:MAG: helix-turn-helix domain-containing protein [Rhodobacteraceae bacterium]|nr:helix-turn-helix domain-containing protein [Paracoccaceae bacterium]